jgi:hypothetical protein
MINSLQPPPKVKRQARPPTQAASTAHLKVAARKIVLQSVDGKQADVAFGTASAACLYLACGKNCT